MEFFTTIDDVFQNIFEKYGQTEELIAYKEQLLDSYINEDKYKAKNILQAITPRFWTVSNEGEITLIK